MSDPTELQSQSDVLRMLADLTETAINAGVSMTPLWSVPASCLVVGSLQSETGEAVRALEQWRHLLGEHSVSSYRYVDPQYGPRQVWKVMARPGGVSVWLTASTPARATARRGLTAVAA
jgi:hypothetical protein